MYDNIFSKDLIFINPSIDSNNRQSIITFLCDELNEKGYINGKYLPEVLKREEIHPTGLPTLPFGSAVPHANPVGVRKTGIALAILNEPISFQAMDNPQNEIDVRLVFLMTFVDGNQVGMLRWISSVISNQDIVKQLVESESPDAAFLIISTFLEANNKGA